MFVANFAPIHLRYFSLDNSGPVTDRPAVPCTHRCRYGENLLPPPQQTAFTAISCILSATVSNTCPRFQLFFLVDVIWMSTRAAPVKQGSFSSIFICKFEVRGISQQRRCSHAGLHIYSILLSSVLWKYSCIFLFFFLFYSHDVLFLILAS